MCVCVSKDEGIKYIKHHTHTEERNEINGRHHLSLDEWVPYTEKQDLFKSLPNGKQINSGAEL